jgi:hypothetical protein
MAASMSLVAISWWRRGREALTEKEVNLLPMLI